MHVKNAWHNCAFAYYNLTPNMKFSLLAALLTGAVSATDASNDSKASDVVVLTGETFADFVSENPLALVEFYAPWCGHCKNLAPEYEKAAAILKEENVALAKVDCTNNQELCAGFEIAGYPTLKIFRGEDKFSDYRGGRTVDTIVKYMQMQNTPLITEVSSKNLDDFLSGGTDFAAVAFLDKKQEDELKTFNKIAESFRERIRSGISTDKKLAAKYGVKSPSLIMLKRGEEPAIFDGEFAPEELAKFFNVESFPSFGDLGPQNFQNYVEAGLPLLYAFVTTEAEKEQVREIMAPLLKEIKGKANAVFLNATVFGDHAANLGLKREFPAILIHDMKSNQKFPHSQESKLNGKSVTDYIKSWVSGELKPTFKSAPVPKSQKGPVHVLVGDSFEDVVLNSDKDVLVEFYAPWCGHCKNLAPTYDKLGEAFAKDKQVVIAKLDHTENEVPLIIQSYPTIYLFKAGSKDQPIAYQGTRSLEDLVKFVKTHSSSDVDIEAVLDKINEDSIEFDTEDAHDEL